MQDQYLTVLDQSLETVEGFPYPQWRKLWDWARQHVTTEDDQELFVATLVEEWLDRIGQRLGEPYQIYESDRFMLISAEGSDRARGMLEFAERSLSQIRRILGEIAFRGGLGKHVILKMEDVDTYWRYISYFFRRRKSSTSAGVFLNHGYGHIVLAPVADWQQPGVLFHELIHNCLMHLHIPYWLNESLTHHVERSGGYARPFQMDAAMGRRHWDFWNAEKIQGFWSGRSFQRPDDWGQLSLELAHILIQLIFSDIRPDREAFAHFVQEASWKDAGEASARKHLGVGLGEIAAIFLGEGNWTPVPPESAETKPD